MNNPYFSTQNPYQNLAQQQQIQFYQNQLAQLEQQRQAQNQFQQMQNQAQVQPQPTNGITGRVVVKEEEINPFEVPANSQYGFFPTQDMSVIYAKTWNKNGDIDTRTYIEYIPENKQENNENVNGINAMDFIQELQSFRQETMARFDALEGTGKAEIKSVKESDKK